MTPALVLFLLPMAYSPGPGNLFFAAAGARFGVRATWAASLGYHLVTWAVTAAIGFGSLGAMEGAPGLFSLIRLAGVAYVLWIVFGFLRAGAGIGQAEAPSVRFRDGAVLLLLNPKAYVIIALMFSQFLPDVGTARSAGVLWITTVFTLNNLVAFTLWTLLGAQLARLFQAPEAGRWMNIGMGVLLAGVAFWMALA